MNDFTPLYDLKNVELEVVRLRNVPEYGVVGRLLAVSICRSSTPASAAADFSIFTNSSEGMKWLHDAVAK